jgi:hypothetical protein
MTDETLETILLGHIAKELKDEIAISRQVNLAKTIMQALRIHDVVWRSEQCAHPRDKREYVGSNMLRCKVCGKEFS